MEIILAVRMIKSLVAGEWIARRTRSRGWMVVATNQSGEIKTLRRWIGGREDFRIDPKRLANVVSQGVMAPGNSFDRDRRFYRKDFPEGRVIFVVLVKMPLKVLCAMVDAFGESNPFRPESESLVRRVKLLVLGWIR